MKYQHFWAHWLLELLRGVGGSVQTIWQSADINRPKSTTQNLKMLGRCESIRRVWWQSDDKTCRGKAGAWIECRVAAFMRMWMWMTKERLWWNLHGYNVWCASAKTTLLRWVTFQWSRKNAGDLKQHLTGCSNTRKIVGLRFNDHETKKVGTQNNT